MAENLSILILSQVFPPDPAAVGMQMADLATGLAARGHKVRVLTSARGYEDATRRYPSREDRDGVHIRRLPFASFGKRSLTARVLGQMWFLFESLVSGLAVGRIDRLVITTSPPMVGLVALPLARLKKAALSFWVMDVNPDQIVALGGLGPRSPLVRLLEILNRRVLRRCDQVIALDRFMAARLAGKVELGRRLSIVPPWPHEQNVEPVAREDNPFRRRHGLEDRLVVMYSGNHSPANPISTLIEAAIRLKDREDIAFLFVGGGLLKSDVEMAIVEHRLHNVTSLPYQPFEELRYSLSAADLHVVTLGEQMVGCIHPSKIYGVMAAARPVLFIGPEKSHVGDILREHEIGWHEEQGDVDGVVARIEAVCRDGRRELLAAGRCAGETLDTLFSQSELMGRLCDAVERASAYSADR